VDIPPAKLACVLRPNGRAPQASFPCSRDAARGLDRQVAETYFQQIGWSRDGSIAAKVAALKAGQRTWLKSPDTACGASKGPAAVSCLMMLTRNRLDALERMTQ
jgi:uncharacterized protein YecT (DUF1311 family)